MTRRTWLRIGALGVVVVVADTLRPASAQESAWVCRKMIGGYRWVKTELKLPARCRFVPSCSAYSDEAFARFGFWRGMELTCSRLCRCRMSVPMGTSDPVPTKLGS